MRSIIYVDGFNLYYGALKGGPNKWLDLERLFRRVRTGDAVQKIKYFTALVDGPARVRQETYLRALATSPLIEILLGKYKYKQVKCMLQQCDYRGPRWFRTPEEKRTDVNIAVQMVCDAFEDRADRFVVVSGDSDLVPAVATIKSRFPNKQVLIYVPTQDPTRGAAVELRSSADKHRDLPLILLRHCQFRSELPDGAGGMILKPAGW